MHIDPVARTVRLSVGELANFRQQPWRDGGGANQWRASVGRQWHKSAEQQARAQYPEARFEVPLKATWLHHDWRFEIQGRIDQLLPTADGLRIREVKTIRAALPLNRAELASRYPEYFAQAAIYLGLARVLPEFAGQRLDAELCFIEIETGTVQVVPLEAAEEARFVGQLERLLPFLQDRRAGHLRLQRVTLQPAFRELRSGQAELLTQLEQAALRSQSVLLEAPTGFGKTGIVLQHALQHMQRGLYQRCIYLSSKSTGQLQTIRQLRAMLGEQLRFMQMRNRSEHRIDSAAHSCSADRRCDESIEAHWQNADIDPPQLFEHGTLSLERAKALGAQTGVCPYALSKGCLPFADIWIGDSNYIFAPGSQAVFLSAAGFDPAKTLLIVDEAHNLPERTADALSVELSAAELLFALQELRATRAPRQLLTIGDELIRCLEALPSGERIASNAHYTILDLCEDFSQQLHNAPIDYHACAPFATDIVWRIPALADALAQAPHQWLHWTPERGSLRCTCLDASSWIGTCLQPFGGSILMSATLGPSESFRQHCGLSREQATLARGHAAWRESAYNVAIDTRVDTRLKHRDQHYETTARTIAALIQRSPGVPVAVFFPSYRYAENIQAYLDALNPTLRIQIQPRNASLAEQEAFIDEGLLLADALFLILGSSYAEGIDKLGGRIDTAMVVGPALPEVNAVQQARMQAYPSLERATAFEQVYIVPAMRRIHQALGRLVRAPGQSAKILLHGKRYREPAYQGQLASEYRQATEINSEDALQRWLSEPIPAR